MFPVPACQGAPFYRARGGGASFRIADCNQANPPLSPHLIPILRQLADGRFHSGEVLAHLLGLSRATVWQALTDAEALGVRVFRVRGRGYRLESPMELLDAAALESLLGEASPFAVQVLDTVASTNTHLLQQAGQGAPHGSVVAAELQTRGRGRQGRSWLTGLAGALTFSVLWRFRGGVAGLSGLSLAVGLAVARACEQLGVAGVKLKWPNDVVHDGRKLAGILIEVQGDMLGPSLAVIGIGLNYRVAAHVLDAIDQPVVDLAAIAKSLPSRNAVLAELLRQLSDVLARFEAGGFAALAGEWEARHAHQRKAVRLSLPDRTTVQGIAEGVAPDGALKIRSAAGLLQFCVGEISLRAA